MNPVETLKIVIADDHEFFRTGFRKIIEDQYVGEIEFIAEAPNGVQLVDLVARYKPRVVVTDIQMPRMDGIQACKIIKQQHPGTAVIAFSMYTDTGNIMNMVQAGANGYLAKTSSHQEVAEAIRTVSNNQPYYCSTISQKIYGILANSNQKKQKSKPVQLGEQEKRVMQLICKQLSSKEIAAVMGLSVKTVEHYRQHIQEKINARNVVGIALYAVVHEIVQFSDLL